MTFVLRLPSKSINLGGTFDALKVFAELAAIDPNESGFGYLHGAIHAGDHVLPWWHVNALSRDASRFLALHSHDLSEHTEWFLEQLFQLVDARDTALGSTLEHIGRELASSGLSAPILEADLEAAFAANLIRRRSSGTVRRQVACSLKTWPRVGDLDVVIDEDGVSSGFELKWWGTGVTGRYQTLWDATKLASLVREGQLDSGFLLAGGSRRAWDRNDAFTRLFDDARHITADLTLPAANWWVLPTHGDTRVPAQLTTSSVARQPLTVDGQDYELRLSRVDPGDGNYLVPARAAREAPKIAP